MPGKIAVEWEVILDGRHSQDHIVRDALADLIETGNFLEVEQLLGGSRTFRTAKEFVDWSEGIDHKK